MGKWTTLALSDLADIVTGATPAAQDVDSWGDEIDFITPSDQTEGSRDVEPSRRLSSLGAQRLKGRLVGPGAVNLTCIGSTIGKVSVAARPAVTNQQINSLIAREGIADPTFLYYLVKNWSPILRLEAAGSTTPIVNKSLLSAYKFVVPDIGSQHAIAEVLGAFDDKIAANERFAATALALGDLLYEQSLAEVGGAPTTIGELATRSAIEFSDGYRTKKSEYGKPGLRILRAGDVRDSYVHPNGEDYVSLEYLRQIGIKASTQGDIVLTTKGTVGRVAVVAEAVERVVYSPQICFFRVKDEEQIDRGYLSAWFRSGDLQQQSAALMYKSDMAPYISLRDIRSLRIPVPSIDEQRRIGKAQLALLAAFDASRVESEALARTRDELLPLLMSGKIAVRSAEELVGDVT